MPTKHNIESVKQYFKDNGCTLLEHEYINCNTKMNYICSCGNESEIRWNDFQKGCRCYFCRNKKIKDSKKLDFNFVYNYFKEHGCELLETEYINNHTKMKYRCKCGNISKIIFASFKKSKKCRECGMKKLSEPRIYNYEYVYNYFKKQGCELLEKDYRSSKIKINYICSCGNPWKTSFEKFLRGRRCIECANQKKSEKKFRRKC